MPLLLLLLLLLLLRTCQRHPLLSATEDCIVQADCKAGVVELIRGQRHLSISDRKRCLVVIG